MSKKKKNRADIEKALRKQKDLIDEVMYKHRQIKEMVLKLLSDIPRPNTTKEKIGDELFKIYKEIK